MVTAEYNNLTSEDLSVNESENTRIELVVTVEVALPAHCIDHK